MRRSPRQSGLLWIWPRCSSRVSAPEVGAGLRSYRTGRRGVLLAHRSTLFGPPPMRHGRANDSRTRFHASESIQQLLMRSTAVECGTGAQQGEQAREHTADQVVEQFDHGVLCGLDHVSRAPPNATAGLEAVADQPRGPGFARRGRLPFPRTSRCGKAPAAGRPDRRSPPAALRGRRARGLGAAISPAGCGPWLHWKVRKSWYGAPPGPRRATGAACPPSKSRGRRPASSFQTIGAVSAQRFCPFAVADRAHASQSAAPQPRHAQLPAVGVVSLTVARLV